MNIVVELQHALEDLKNLEIKDMCEDQKSTLKKALVMLRVKWENGKSKNLAINDNIGYYIPRWKWGEFKYSIVEPQKPKKTVPLDFSDRDILRDVWVKRKNYQYESQIVGISEKFVQLADREITYQWLFEKYTFLDDSPISKEVEE